MRARSLLTLALVSALVLGGAAGAADARPKPRKPAITAVTPSVVGAAGGMVVELRGRGFAKVRSVRLGGKPVTGLRVRAGRITFTAPAAVAGTRWVVVRTAAGRARRAVLVRQAWTSVSAGRSYTCGIRRPHTAWCWGDNLNGVVGGGPVGAFIRSPRQLPGEWRQIAAGSLSTCGIRLDKSLWCWGYNAEGQVGDGTTTTRKVPVRVAPGTTWRHVSVGLSHTCGIRTDRTAWCWGDDDFGELGDGAVTGDGANPHLPAQVGGGAGTWSSVEAGSYFTCGIDIGGTWCWGENSADGQLGTGETYAERDKSPTPLLLGVTATQLDVGADHACAVVAAATRCWGTGSFGRLGTGATAGAAVPTPVAGAGRPTLAVTTGDSHSCSLDSRSVVLCWGRNQAGEVGDGTSSQRRRPTVVAGRLTFKQVSSGYAHTCAVTLAGALVCWGRSGEGQFGYPAALLRDPRRPTVVG
ncbi:IPT/TIG domain-containing protein [Nocardioides sp. URHA0020]|uniref:IPT/TIG domain-containing protein n=1 Tax=Nocardioides sp. URHA0020 TaxID=1380392 RepID=UPI0006887658|nr:IPT/TIG domain-containing protein [Nocardioides sp. URHA0020]